MIVEKPDERQWQDMVWTYGPPTFFDRATRIPLRAEESVAPSGSGEVILLIFNLASSCIFVKRKGSFDWFFPMGRIEMGEGIIEAARRAAREGVGVEIEPVGVLPCQRVTFSLNGTTVLRWHIVVVAETASNVLGPTELKGIAEAGLFDFPAPVGDIEMSSWVNELHHIGTRYMRSLDAMDGI
jgi:ADP-ribose pyrophosphatase YjhB (NUDIX family)